MKNKQILLKRVEIQEVPVLERDGKNFLRAKDMKAFREGLEQGLINDDDIVYIENV